MQLSGSVVENSMRKKDFKVVEDEEGGGGTSGFEELIRDGKADLKSDDNPPGTKIAAPRKTQDQINLITVGFRTFSVITPFLYSKLV